MSNPDSVILLVEDNPFDQDFFKTIYAKASYPLFKLRIVNSIKSALEFCSKENNVALILLDLSLPDSEGLEGFMKIHREFIKLPIIILTGLNDMVVATKAIKSGAQDYLVKGEFDQNLLEKSIRYALERQGIIIDRDKKSEQLMIQNRAMESANDGILIVDLKDDPKIIVYVNQSLCTLIGVEKSDILGENCSELAWFFRDKDVFQKIENSLREGLTFEDECTVNEKGSEVLKWIYCSMSPVKGDNGDVCNYVGIFKDISVKKQLEAKVLNTIIETQENERRRIANDLHDGLGQILAATNLYFSSLEEKPFEKWGKNEEEVLKTGSNLVRNAISEVRWISYNLMPSSLETFGLEQTISEMIGNLNGVSTPNLKINLDSDMGTKRFESRLELTMYRIVQELVNNTIKHAKAKQLNLVLHYNDKALTLESKDNGVGFDIEKIKPKGLGLASLEKRVTSLNGDINIDSKINKGTKVKVNIPIDN